MDPKTILKRPKPPTIQTIDNSAPWVLLSIAAVESGLTKRIIRKSQITLRRFGTADYVRPTELNDWINGEEIK